MKFYLIFSFLIFNSLFFKSCVSQNYGLTYTDIYNLDFKKQLDSTAIYNWITNGRYLEQYVLSMANLNRDSLYTLRYNKEFSDIDRFRNEMEQRILLPVHKEKKGQICFEGKGENLNWAYIAVEGLSKEEKILFSDTLTLYLKPELTTQTIDFSLEGIELLRLKIYTEGIKQENAEISFSKMDVFIGGKHIDAYPFRKLSGPLDKKYGIQSLSIDTWGGLDGIEVLKNKKIIGLGESIHGNRCIRELVTQLIMYQVRQQACKLVIIEAPMEQTLVYNDYIKYTIPEIEKDSLGDSRHRELLEQLREYNQGKAEKEQVRLFGMDYEKDFNTFDSSFRSIFDYIAGYNQEVKAEVLDHFALLLMEESPDIEKIISYMETNKSLFLQYLSSENYKCIRHILPLSLSVGTNQNERNYRRDSIMAINTRFILDSIGQSDEQAILYGHAVHLNPVSTYPAMPCLPLGYYLKDEYGEDYSTMLFTIGTGSYKAAGMAGTLEEKALELSVEGSLEAFLNSFEEDVFYLPFTPDFEKLILSRFLGNRHSKQEFYPYNLYQRYDGVFFIKDCVRKGPLSLYERVNQLQSNTDPDSKEWKQIDDELKNALEEGNSRIMNKIEERERLLTEIKERIQK